jgi:NitT/TauT family transport system substrate-binding protein
MRTPQHPISRACSALLLAGLLVLAACGGSGSATGEGESAPADAPAAEPASPGETQEQTEAAAPAEVRQLVVVRGSPNLSADDAYLYAGKAMGFYEEEGLDVEFQYLQAGGTAVPTLLATGGAEMAIMSGQPLAAAAESGLADEAGLLAVCLNYVQSIFDRFVVPGDSEIQDYDDLAGKTLGVFDLGSAGAGPARGILTAAGVDPSQVEFLAVGAGPGAAEALASGQVDALSSWDTQYQLFDSLGYGFRELPPVELPDISSVVATTRQFADENPEVVEGFLRATAKSIVFAKANPERAVELFLEQNPQAVGDATPEEALARDVARFQARLPRLDYMENGTGEACAFPGTETWQGMAEWLGISGDHDWENYFTDEFVEAANDFDAEEVEDQAAAE